MIFVLQYKVK